MTVWGNGTKTKPAISSPYGPRSGGAFSFHYGCDFKGYPLVHSVESGTVTFAGFMNNNAGYVVTYDLDWKGPKGEIIAITHMHLAANTLRVKKGQRIGEATVLGAMGDSGNATGNCDHIEVRYWQNGAYVTQNPDVWLTTRVLGGSTAGSGSTTDLYGVVYAKAAQTFLQTLNLYPGPIDGDFGPNSIAGTKTFQNWVGITEDGVFGPDTNKWAGIVKTGGKFVARPTSEIQQFLKDQGVFPFTVDDGWGNQTSVSTIRYQRGHGLTADGQWGAATDAKAFPPVTPPPPVTGPVGKNVTQRPTTEIQTLLKGKGLYSGPVDGDYGAGTTAAVVALQKEGGLEADGIWGANTDVYGFKRDATLLSAKQGVIVNGGTVVAGRKITGVNVHHYGSTGDDRGYFANPMNGRKSCPTITIMASGEGYEYIPPSLQPWSTSAADKDRISVEFQNSTGAPDWQISAQAIETFINLLVELRLATMNGSKIDGTDVNVVLDRAHIQGDQEFRATVCPGPYVMNNLLDWIAAAQARVDAVTGPTDPPPVEPTDYVVSREVGDQIRDLVNGAFPDA